MSILSQVLIQEANLTGNLICHTLRGCGRYKIDVWMEIRHEEGLSFIVIKSSLDKEIIWSMGCLTTHQFNLPRSITWERRIDCLILRKLFSLSLTLIFRWVEESVSMLSHLFPSLYSPTSIGTRESSSSTMFPTPPFWITIEGLLVEIFVG